jgi:hypothetical protein
MDKEQIEEKVALLEKKISETKLTREDYIALTSAYSKHITGPEGLPPTHDLDSYFNEISKYFNFTKEELTFLINEPYAALEIIAQLAEIEDEEKSKIAYA